MSEAAIHPKWFGTAARRRRCDREPLVVSAADVAAADEVDRVGTLTGRQMVLLRRYARGEDRVALATSLGISEGAIHKQFTVIYHKLGIAADRPGRRTVGRACYLAGRWDERYRGEDAS